MTSSKRRFAAVGLAAVLAAGPLAALSAAPASAATKPGYVAVVVVGHGSYCVKWASGITGDTVLNAVATVHYRQSDGIIDAIDNDPSPPHADDTHYWSYWHDTSGSWTYSSVGASSYDAKAGLVAGSVEGWTFDDGHTPPGPAPTQNPSGLYASLCGPHDSAAGGSSGSGGGRPRQSTPANRVPVQHTSGTREHVYHPRANSGTSTSTPSAAPKPSGTASPTASTTGPTSTGLSSSRPAPATTSQPASTEPGVRTGSSAAGAPIADVDATPVAASSHSSSSSGSLTSVVLGIGLVLLLGGGAAFVVLRRRAANAGY